MQVTDIYGGVRDVPEHIGKALIAAGVVKAAKPAAKPAKPSKSAKAKQEPEPEETREPEAE